MQNINKWLREGKQTKITPLIKKITSQIPGENFNFIINLISWINNNLNKKPHNKKNFRKRTANQILNDKYTTGCTDVGLIFVVICRCKKIPTKYIETVRKEWLLKNQGEEGGHIFAEIYINKKWYLIDPTKGIIFTKIFYKPYLLYKYGLDSWDLGIKSYKDWCEKMSEFKQRIK